MTVQCDKLNIVQVGQCSWITQWDPFAFVTFSPSIERWLEMFYCLGEQHAKKIRAIAMSRMLTFTASGPDIFIFSRGKKVTLYETLIQWKPDKHFDNWIFFCSKYFTNFTVTHSHIHCVFR